jgi:hypothetical protein
MKKFRNKILFGFIIILFLIPFVFSLLEFNQTTNLFSISGNVNATNQINFTHIQISNSAPYNSLNGYWNFFDNGINRTAYDLSGNNRNGTYTNGAFINTSCGLGYGTCAGFDGTNDGINYGALNFTENYSISLWYRTLGSGSGQIIAKDTGSGGGNRNFGIGTDTAYWFDPSGNAVSISLPIQVNTSLITMRFRMLAIMRYYIYILIHGWKRNMMF